MPISPNSTDVTSWESMTEAVNEIKPSNSAIFNMLFAGRSEPKETKTIELSYIRRGRQIAPFVKRGSAARMIGGANEDRAVVEPPHIRIKRPMEPTKLLNDRLAGTRIFVDRAEQQSAIDAYMARELSFLDMDANESLEWLCAQMLTGTVSYSSADDVAFTITVPRLGTHSYDLAATFHWDEANARIAKDFLDAHTLVNDDVSLNLTDVLLGNEAADAFLANAAMQALLKQNVNQSIQVGSISFVEQMEANGLLYLGNPFRGIRVWRYGRTTSVNGVSTPMIRPKYAEFVTARPEAQNVTYYGPIEDFDAFGEGGSYVRERFSKSWVEKDPSVRWALLETNPLPCLRRPDSTVSVKVVSG